MAYLRQFGLFLWEVITNWAGFVTGGLVVALIWLWSTILQAVVPRKVAIGIAIFFLFCAVFNAWRKRYLAQQATEKKVYDGRPRLTLMLLNDEPRTWIQAQNVFSVQNSGERAARFITFKPISSPTGKYCLNLISTNPEVLISNFRPMVAYEISEKGSTGRVAELMKSDFASLQLFFKDGEGETINHLIEIHYQDMDGSELTDKMTLECKRPTNKLSIRPFSSTV